MGANDGFDRFVEALRNPDGTWIAPERFASALALRQQDLAQLAHVHRSTVTDAPANAKLQGYMRDTLRVLSAAMQTTSESNRAIFWFRNVPIPEFGHQTAERLVATGHTDAVLSYLAVAESGSSG